MKSTLFALIILMPLGCTPAPVPSLPDPSIDVIEQEYKELCAEIRRLQQESETLILKLAREIEEEGIDVKVTQERVNDTTAKIQKLRQKAQQLNEKATRREFVPAT